MIARIIDWCAGNRFLVFTGTIVLTLWGVWAASPTDAWVAGGSPEKGTAAPNDVILHWDGKAWAPDPLPQPLVRGAVLEVEDRDLDGVEPDLLELVEQAVMLGRYLGCPEQEVHSGLHVISPLSLVLGNQSGDKAGMDRV